MIVPQRLLVRASPNSIAWGTDKSLSEKAPPSFLILHPVAKLHCFASRCEIFSGCENSVFCTRVQIFLVSHPSAKIPCFTPGFKYSLFCTLPCFCTQV